MSTPDRVREARDASITRQFDRLLEMCAGDVYVPNLIGALRRTVNKMRAEHAAEIAALKADGERLDWLEAEANGPHGLHLHDGTHAGCNGLGLKRLNRTLRDAIDAARAEGK